MCFLPVDFKCVVIGEKLTLDVNNELVLVFKEGCFYFNIVKS